MRKLQFYEARGGDPDWLKRAARYHGHLGPWVTVGAMIGHDAVRRLETRGFWEIDVTSWMPIERQQPPQACILDGLQATSGATIGKQNIRFAVPPRTVEDEWPSVAVIRHAAPGHPAAGLIYRLTPLLREIMSEIKLDRLEAVARDIADRTVDDMFDVRAMTAEEVNILTELRQRRPGENG